MERATAPTGSVHPLPPLSLGAAIVAEAAIATTESRTTSVRHPSWLHALDEFVTRDPSCPGQLGFSVLAAIIVHIDEPFANPIDLPP